jgi:hypothetical protein
MAAEPLDPNLPDTSITWNAWNENVLVLTDPRDDAVIALTRREQAALLDILSQQHLEADSPYRTCGICEGRFPANRITGHVTRCNPRKAGVTWTPTRH